MSRNLELVKEGYAKTVEDNIKGKQNPTWNEIKEVIHSAAKEHVGNIKQRFNKMEYSKEIEKLSQKQKQNRIQINNSKSAKKITKRLQNY